MGRRRLRTFEPQNLALNSEKTLYEHPASFLRCVTLVLLLGSGCGLCKRIRLRTIQRFKMPEKSAVFFNDVMPTLYSQRLAPVGLGVGGARGAGQVYVHDRLVGDAVMTQVSIGFQAGGKAYSEIIFFQDKRHLDEFESR